MYIYIWLPPSCGESMANQVPILILSRLFCANLAESCVVLFSYSLRLVVFGIEVVRHPGLSHF